MRITFMTLASTILLTGCGTASDSPTGANAGSADGEPPEDVSQSAIMAVSDLYGRVTGETVDQVKITNSGESALTAADLANGLRAKWCINVSFIARSARYTDNPWEDHYRVVVVTRDDNGLKPRLLTNYSGKASEAAGAFARCLTGAPPA